MFNARHASQGPTRRSVAQHLVMYVGPGPTEQYRVQRRLQAARPAELDHLAHPSEPTLQRPASAVRPVCTAHPLGL